MEEHAFDSSKLHEYLRENLADFPPEEGELKVFKFRWDRSIERRMRRSIYEISRDYVFFWCESHGLNFQLYFTYDQNTFLSTPDQNFSASVSHHAHASKITFFKLHLHA